MVKEVDVATLARQCTPRTVEVDDPNYGARKRYRACPLTDVLTFGLGAAPATLGNADVFIRAWDGYDKPASAASRQMASARVSAFRTRAGRRGAGRGCTRRAPAA